MATALACSTRNSLNYRILHLYVSNIQPTYYTNKPNCIEVNFWRLAINPGLARHILIYAYANFCLVFKVIRDSSLYTNVTMHIFSAHTCISLYTNTGIICHPYFILIVHTFTSRTTFQRLLHTKINHHWLFFISTQSQRFIIFIQRKL